MLYYFNKGESATEMRAVYGEGAVTDWTCQKWFAEFRAGDFSLDDAPFQGRLVEVHSDQIETLIENNECSAMRETADILKICKSLKLLVKMKNVSFILQKKTKRTFWATQYICVYICVCISISWLICTNILISVKTKLIHENKVSFYPKFKTIKDYCPAICNTPNIKCICHLNIPPGAVKGPAGFLAALAQSQEGHVACE